MNKWYKKLPTHGLNIPNKWHHDKNLKSDWDHGNKLGTVAKIYIIGMAEKKSNTLIYTCLTEVN